MPRNFEYAAPLDIVRGGKRPNPLGKTRDAQYNEDITQYQTDDDIEKLAKNSSGLSVLNIKAGELNTSQQEMLRRLIISLYGMRSMAAGGPTWEEPTKIISHLNQPRYDWIINTFLPGVKLEIEKLKGLVNANRALKKVDPEHSAFDHLRNQTEAPIDVGTQIYQVGTTHTASTNLTPLFEHPAEADARNLDTYVIGAVGKLKATANGSDRPLTLIDTSTGTPVTTPEVEIPRGTPEKVFRIAMTTSGGRQVEIASLKMDYSVPGTSKCEIILDKREDLKEHFHNQQELGALLTDFPLQVELPIR
jgi:hypothetical protein